MTTKKISVAIVDDHTLFREGVGNLLAEFGDIEVLFDASNGLEFQQKLSRGNVPDIVLLDINMPGMDGFELAAWLKSNFPLVRILVLSMYEDDKSIIRMMRNGAGGYVLKESRASEVAQAIRTIHAKGYFINDLVSGKLIHSLRDEGSPKERALNLSEREKEFLIMCCSEMTYKEIADKMNISVRTIDSYRDNLFDKLSLKSRTGLAMYAIKNNLVAV